MQLLELELCAALRLDAAGTVVEVGQGFERILAWGAAEILGRDWMSLCEAGHGERFERAFANLAAGAPSATVRASFPRHPEPLLLVCRMAAHGDGTLVVCEDVTKKTAAVEGTSNLEKLVDFAADAWFVHDLDGKIRDANSWACRNLGYTREEMLALRVADFETTIKPGRMDGVWNRMEIGVPISVEGRQIRKDRTTFPVDVRLGLFESDGEVLMLAIARDITKLKAVESELQGLNADLEAKVVARTRDFSLALAQRQAMLDSLSDGIVAVDSVGVVELANPALETLLGRQVPIGADSSQVLPPDLIAVIAASFEGKPASGEARLHGERIIQIAAAPILDNDRVDGVVALIHDVTLEREVDRMKTDFIATVSHELRTPLTSVLGFAKVTRKQLESKIFSSLDLADPEVSRAVGRVRNNIDIIRSEGERLTSLINDVLDISKMESGRMEWDFHRQPVEVLVRSAAEATRGLFLEGVSLAVEVEPTLPEVRVDRDRLLQILINLLSNAAKFANGAVRMSARRDGDDVLFEVSDDGEGIEPALQPTIFEKFRQVGDTLTDKPKGTGLGLPICQQIAQAHDTRIYVDSEPGQGARFYFSLAADSAGDAGTRVLTDSVIEHVQRRIPRRDSGHQILVVDDDANIRELLRQQLGERGYEVRQAANGYEAIGQVRSSRPDLIILDVMMPELSGFDVAAMLKNDPATESIPILILSVIEDEDRGLRVGVDRYLTKPADSEEVLGAVRELLAEHAEPRRILVVDENGAMSGEIVQLLEEKGYLVVDSCHAVDCLETVRATEPDLVILESLLDDSQDLLRTIRFDADLQNLYVLQLVEEGA